MSAAEQPWEKQKLVLVLPKGHSFAGYNASRSKAGSTKRQATKKIFRGLLVELKNPL